MGAELSRLVRGVAAALGVLLCLGFGAARAQPVPGTAAAEILDDALVEGLPGPAAIYDPNQGQPQALLREPRQVLFPDIRLPFDPLRTEFRRRIFDEYGLTYALSYQQLVQHATATLTGRQSTAIGGWAGNEITWTPLDRGGDYQGTLVFRGGWRGPVGNNNAWPAVFGPLNLGSAWSNYEFTSWRGRYEVEDLFWEQRLGPTFSFRIGNQGAQATINTFRFKDARSGFTASPLAFSETIPYPAFGAGLSFRWTPDPTGGVYVRGAINDMNGNPGFGSLNWSRLRADQLFVGVELGYQWRRQDGSYDQLSILPFHAGTRSTFNAATTPNQAGYGFKVLGEKQFGRTVAFAAYTYNTARGGGISTTFSGNTAVAGAALIRPFGIRGEIAAAAMWTLPFRDLFFPGQGQRAQYGFETYWNLAVTPNMSLTPGVQLIWHPAFNPGVNFIAVPHIKFRIFI